jgi:hypothetical protein
MYSFKRDAKVYFLINGVRYNVDISDIGFGQELDDALYEAKTVQEQEMFAQVVVTAFKPANFNMTFPAIREDDFQAIFDRALDYGTFDLYVTNKSDLFKIENCVITNTSFIVVKNRPLALSISGEGSRLTRTRKATVPGTVRARSGNMTYNKVSFLDIILDGVDTLDRVTSVAIELQTDIDWIPYNELGELCVSEEGVVYPGKFTVTKRILSGTLSSYRLDPITWSTNATLYMRIGQEVGQKVYGFIFDLDSVAYTSRGTTGDIYTHNYDWRLTQNPTSLSELIKYITDATDDSRAILDYWGDAILDSDGLPILDSF